MLCVFNPEHDLCLAKGRWNYVPPRSALDFASRDASIMQVLYPDAVCMSVYDPKLKDVLSCGQTLASAVIAWGWNAVVKHELLKRGAPEDLLPSDEEIETIREMQHRSTVLPLQEGCREVHSVEEMEALLKERRFIVVAQGMTPLWISEKLAPGSQSYSILTSFGGIRSLRYTLDDAQWAEAHGA